MSKTTRNQDFWRMRQFVKLAQAESAHLPPGHGNEPPMRGSALWWLHKMWSDYGFKSMVMDKRRRVSTRKTNSEFVRALRRAKRHRDALQWRRHASEQSDALD
jgi:hypothetical protein